MKTHRKTTPSNIATPTARNLDYSYLTNDLIEQRLNALLPPAEQVPQLLHRAMRHAVFSGGKRLRPRLLIAVVASCGVETRGSAEIDLALNAACAVEFLHAASLIHDDLPAFDDAPERRGKPTVHVLFGEPLAILAGDALLSCAYEVIAKSPASLAHRSVAIIRLMGAAAGSREGIIGGQSMEQDLQSHPEGVASDGEATPPAFTPDMLERYHFMKSAALFRLAAVAGALVAGHENLRDWAKVGDYLGLALQLADDLGDVAGQSATLGKPVGRDAQLHRPNAALVHGQTETRHRMWTLLQKTRTLAASLVADPKPLVALLNQSSSYFGLTAI